MATIGFDVSDLATGREDGTTRYTRELAVRLPEVAPDHTWHYFAPAAFPEESTIRATSHISPWPKYWTQSRLPWDVMRVRPDLLYMPIQQLPYLRPRRLKTVAVVHDLAFHYYPQQFTRKDWLLQHMFTAYAVRQADRIIAVSHATAADIAREYGRTDGVAVVHHAVDHERFYVPTDEERAAALVALREQYLQLPAEYILFVGQIQPRKNLTGLVAAFEQYREQGGTASLVIAGGHGWMQQPILNRIAASPYQANIILPGVVPDDLLSALYWGADTFVLPSFYEGFGMPVLEAFACGTPTVIAATSSLLEVADGAAVLCDPYSVNSIAEALLAAREKAAELRAAGVARAAQFTWNTTTAKTWGVIEETLGVS